MIQKIKLFGILLTIAMFTSCNSKDKKTNIQTEIKKEEVPIEVKVEGTKKVWIDADLAVGMKNINRPGYSDVDDGYAVLQLLNADNIEIIGMSTVFGNNSIENAFTIGNYINTEFIDQKIPVFKGAGKPIDSNNVMTSDAVEALASALKKERLTILAIGPATNIGVLLLKYPDLKSQIIEVVLVAGRRTAKDHFNIGTKGVIAKDLNFDLDNAAFQVLLDNEVPVVLCPFEISSKVWIEQQDLDTLKTINPAMKWLATASQPWIEQWTGQGATGFNPFDALASHYIIAPEDIVSEPLLARLELHLDDTIKENKNQVFKQYLLCDETKGTPVKYCFDVVPGYHQKLIASYKK
ncbi:Inosine/uridine-preferring nucleoside hydrolase [Cellulophaga algicola DSM 14237]|uniref:Inosine/uridine-preferring nucleoside hydrolase n=1 Tax=Cellulophaga algicola (strain DSM 14237 / IC166 / ACAM 630) TaxID=688270 RepID=E6XB15_CELAD|nr:nucleoside hydrolase [Cellulophaga algicola]ADV48871.1 Inosine/uridine-preferring nucleoside hydrolase [Cellulophaga algicola DSM 14237]